MPLPLKFCPWNSESSVLSAPTDYSKAWKTYYLNNELKTEAIQSMLVSACTKLHIKFLIIVYNIFMIIFRNYFKNSLSCPFYFKMSFFWSKFCPRYFRNFGQICIQVDRVCIWTQKSEEINIFPSAHRRKCGISVITCKVKTDISNRSNASIFRTPSIIDNQLVVTEN